MAHTLDFLPEISQVMLDATQEISLYQAISCVQKNSSSSLLRMIDVDAIAEKLDMKSNLVIAGIGAITPILLADFIRQCETYTNVKENINRT